MIRKIFRLFRGNYLKEQVESISEIKNCQYRRFKGDQHAMELYK